MAALQCDARDVIWALRTASIDVFKAGRHLCFTDDYRLALPLLDSLQHGCLLSAEIMFVKAGIKLVQFISQCLSVVDIDGLLAGFVACHGI